MKWRMPMWEMYVLVSLKNQNQNYIREKRHLGPTRLLILCMSNSLKVVCPRAGQGWTHHVNTICCRIRPCRWERGGWTTWGVGPASPSWKRHQPAITSLPWTEQTATLEGRPTYATWGKVEVLNIDSRWLFHKYWSLSVTKCLALNTWNVFS